MKQWFSVRRSAGRTKSNRARNRRNIVIKNAISLFGWKIPSTWHPALQARVFLSFVRPSSSTLLEVERCQAIRSIIYGCWPKSFCSPPRRFGFNRTLLFHLRRKDREKECAGRSMRFVQSSQTLAHKYESTTKFWLSWKWTHSDRKAKRKERKLFDKQKFTYARCRSCFSNATNIFLLFWYRWLFMSFIFRVASRKILLFASIFLSPSLRLCFRIVLKSYLTFDALFGFCFNDSCVLDETTPPTAKCMSRKQQIGLVEFWGHNEKLLSRIWTA